MRQFWLGVAASTSLFVTFYIGRWMAYSEIEATEATIEIPEPNLEPLEKRSQAKIPASTSGGYVSPRTMRTELCDTIDEKRRLGDYMQECLHNGNVPDGCLATGAALSCRNEKLKKQN